MNFMQGTLDLLLLKSLDHGPLHGYDLVEWIRQVTRGVIQIEDGALYASLHRMEGKGWLDHDWAVSPKGRRAKYYRLTAEGHAQLRAGESSWTQFAGAVREVFAAGQDR